jgi:hypothetical protein
MHAQMQYMSSAMLYVHCIIGASSGLWSSPAKDHQIARTNSWPLSSFSNLRPAIPPTSSEIGPFCIGLRNTPAGKSVNAVTFLHNYSRVGKKG